MTYVDPVAVTSKSAEGGVEVTVSGRSRIPQDGIVDLIAAGATLKNWPAAQYFHGLAQGQDQSLRFVVPDKAAVDQIRVRCGDRQMLEIKVPYTVQH